MEELAAAETVLISKSYLVFSTCNPLRVVDIYSGIQGARLRYPYPRAVLPDYNTILSETNHVLLSRTRYAGIHPLQRGDRGKYQDQKGFFIWALKQFSKLVSL